MRHNIRRMRLNFIFLCSHNMGFVPVLTHEGFFKRTSSSEHGFPTVTNIINCTKINEEAYEQKSAIHGNSPEEKTIILLADDIR